MKASYAFGLLILACSSSSAISLAQSEAESIKVQAPPAVSRYGGDNACAHSNGVAGEGRAGHGGPQRPSRGPDALIESLGLSDNQREQLHSIRSQDRLAGLARQAEMTKLQHQLMDGLSSDSLDKNQALSIQGQINALSNANQTDKVSSMVASRGIFTEEQRKLMRRHMLEHELHMPGPPMPGPPMGGPPLSGHPPFND